MVQPALPGTQQQGNLSLHLNHHFLQGLEEPPGGTQILGCLKSATMFGFQCGESKCSLLTFNILGILKVRMEEYQVQKCRHRSKIPQIGRRGVDCKGGRVESQVPRCLLSTMITGHMKKYQRVNKTLLSFCVHFWLLCIPSCQSTVSTI